MMSDDDAYKYIPRSINTRTASDKTFQLAQQWLKECLSSHPDCNLKNIPFKPTRLVQIIQASASWHVRLIRPSLAVNYVALSYCWGGTQATLTKSVEKSWETSIDKGQLLQTIQDAIYVTMRLGIEYIWIDSLCIIQEDSIEKSQEIAKMADVYSSATFTLAASSAATAHEGFLQDRHVTDFPEEVFDLPYKCPNGQISTITLFRPISTLTESREAQSPNPLNQRGWAFQERWLSRRFLDFTTANLQWTCVRSLISGTSYVDGWLQDSDLTFPLINGSEDPLSGWHMILTAYTTRKLSVSKDRILAISGVAQGMHEFFNDGAYWAGLWECEYPVELMWRAITLDSDFQKGRSLPPRPKDFQGPSWSWVAVNANVFHNRELRKFTPVINVEKCEIELFDSKAPYGAVNDARLHAFGHVQKFILLWKYSSIADAWQWNLRDEGGTDFWNLGNIDLDALEPEFIAKTSGEIEVYLLEVLKNVEEFENRDALIRTESCGLMLRKHSGSHYSRLGVFWLSIHIKPGDLFSWFKYGHQTHLTLI
jgi:hypothetical protein